MMAVEHGILGRSIRAAREKKSLTQENLAEILEISAMHVKQIESGRRNPSVNLLFKIVQALDMSLDKMISPQNNDTKDINPIIVKINQCTEKQQQALYKLLDAFINKI